MAMHKNGVPIVGHIIEAREAVAGALHAAEVTAQTAADNMKGTDAGALFAQIQEGIARFGAENLDTLAFLDRLVTISQRRSDRRKASTANQ